MRRGLDHVVHVVRDLDAGAEFYRRLGFVVSPRTRQPWGTASHVIQLPGFYIEIVSVMRPERYGGEGFEAFFTHLNASFLRRQEGLSFLIVESADLQADATAFGEAGIGISNVLDFEPAQGEPEGHLLQTGLSLVFARDAGAPGLGFAACRHHHPENFWKTSLQQHANSVNMIGGVVLVAENPTDHHIFLSAFTGERGLQATSSGITAPTPRGDVQVMDTAAFRSHFGIEAPDHTTGARLAALRLKIRDRDALAAALDAGGIEFSFHMGAAVVAPDAAMGATLVFEAEGPHCGG